MLTFHPCFFENSKIFKSRRFPHHMITHIYPRVTLDLKEYHSRWRNGEHSDSLMYLEHLRSSVHFETVNNVGLGDAAVRHVSSSESPLSKHLQR